MNELLKKTDKSKLKAIAYYQIIGGILGIGLIIYSLLNQSINTTNYKFILLIIAIGLYIFSIVSGLYLVKEKWEKGINLTTINQMLQTIQFSILGFTYIFVSGLTLYAGIDYTNEFLLKFNFLFTNFQFTLTLKDEVLTVGVNLFALFLLYYIMKLKHRIEEMKELLDNAKEKTDE